MQTRTLPALFALLGVAAGIAMPSGARAAQPYPARAVRLIVPSSPGGGTDITARTIAPKMGEALGQQVVVDNRPGAGTMIGGEAVARAAPDGYTLLMGISTLAINPATYKKVPYDALKDFAPISQAVVLPNILVVHPSMPVKSVKELIRFAKAHPGEIDFASAGVGTNPHLSMELFLSMAHLKMVHVPYKGSGPGAVALVAGHVQVMTPSIITALGYVRGGRLRALAVTSANRAPGAPDIPTMAEAGLPGYEATQWYGVLAPAGTPQAIIAKVHGAVVKALKDRQVIQSFVSGGASPVGSTPEQFAHFIRTETTKWARIARESGIQPK